MHIFKTLFTFILFTTFSCSAFIPPNSVAHIKQRHWHNATQGPNTSHFNKSMNVKKLDAIATKTIQNGSVRNSTHGQGRKTHQYKFQRPIGRDSSGKKSKTMRVVTDKNGQIITAFPV